KASLRKRDSLNASLSPWNPISRCEILTPGAIGGHQVLTDAALWRAGQQGPALLEVVLEMRSLPMRLQRRLVPVDLVEIKTVRIVLVLDHGEAKTTRLVLFRIPAVVTGDLQKFFYGLRVFLFGHM